MKKCSISYSYAPATLALDTETITIDPDGSGTLPALTRVLDRSTDTLGRQSGTAVSAVGSGTPEHFNNYGYDNSGRLVTVTSPAGTFSYAYTPNSSLIASVAGPVHTVTNTWEPNRDVLDTKENKIPSTNTTISSFNYGVNAIGQRTGVQTTGTAFPSQPADWIWGYDALGQVVTADSPTAGFDRAYEYDQIGNRKKSADGALITTGSSATVYDADNLNQYSEIQNQQSSIVNPVHDADGNATSYPLPVAPTTNATLAYDGENRLVSVTTGTTTVSYTYDAQSRRIARTEGTATTLYLYDGWNCLAEYSTSGLQTFDLKTAYTWGLDLSGTLQAAGGGGGLLAVTKHQAPTTTHYCPTFDGNGNVSEYLDASGTIAAHYEYDPFGRNTVANGPPAGDFEYRFSTKPVDVATGLCYYGYRWYDSETGRWCNRDPIEEKGGSNLYAFVVNRGVFTIDVKGLWPWTGCCNGEKYNKIYQCCRDGLIFYKGSSVPSGVYQCYKMPSGGSPYPHAWIEVPPSFSMGFHPGGNPFGGPGLLITPESWAGTTLPTKAYTCLEVPVYPCDADPQHFRKRVLEWKTMVPAGVPAAPYSTYIFGLKDCKNWVAYVIFHAYREASYPVKVLPWAF